MKTKGEPGEQGVAALSKARDDMLAWQHRSWLEKRFVLLRERLHSRLVWAVSAIAVSISVIEIWFRDLATFLQWLGFPPLAWLLLLILFLFLFFVDATANAKDEATTGFLSMYNAAEIPTRARFQFAEGTLQPQLIERENIENWGVAGFHFRDRAGRMRTAGYLIALVFKAPVAYTQIVPHGRNVVLPLVSEAAKTEYTYIAHVHGDLAGADVEFTATFL